MIYLCHISGGVSSWMMARRVVDQHGPENVVCIFADVLIEEESTYWFLDAAVKNLGAKFVRLCDGRTPWQVFHDVKFLGNSRVDPCSRILKRELIDKYVRENFTSENSVQCFGFDWTEEHRLEKVRKRLNPWPVAAPLCAPPYLSKDQIIEAAMSAGLPIPTLYGLGFSHNNCGGKCVKAGQAHYKNLLDVLPEVYAEVEADEEKLRCELGDVSILRDRRGGNSRPLSLREFRFRILNNVEYDKFDYGSCSCFSEVTDD